MARKTLAWCGIISLCFSAIAALSQSSPPSEFISLPAATPVVTAFRNSLPAELKSAKGLDAAKWNAWVRQADQNVRDRLSRGDEDTLTNLLRFGVTFTREYRIDDPYLRRLGESSLVNSFAENRANALIRALSTPSAWTPNTSEGMERMRTFLEKRGFSFRTPEQRLQIKKYLLANLARMRDDIVRYRAEVNEESRSQLFKDRGISLDTNLWPDFLLDQHFRRMAEKGLLASGSVRRIAIVGPGLDFANKEKGNDFYPPQTVQPFAVVDSLLRLGLADAATVEVYTLDISSDVNFHLANTRKKAAAGRAYTVQLPWNSSARLTGEYRQQFMEYWKKLGEKIGEPVAPIAVPSAATDTETRAVRIHPDIVRRVAPLDMNIVFQRLALAPDREFDLVIGTNIFIYYDAFEQSLARANIAAMLRPGGYLLSNDKFPDTVPSGLASALETTLIVARDPDRTDTMFCYKKEK